MKNFIKAARASFILSGEDPVTIENIAARKPLRCPDAMLQTAQTPGVIFILTAGIELNVYLRSPGPYCPGFSC
jgi:hypothetical protein